ncbi:MAG: HEAT repeat domain-containing protein [Rhodospirillales bacterium]|nr:HEAT repeat domain-containing protein [Rhodospirillales bacterium]
MKGRTPRSQPGRRWGAEGVRQSSLSRARALAGTLAGALAVLLVCAGAMPVAGPASAAALDIAVNGNQLSADLGAVPLADVLGSVARQTGAALSIRGDLGKIRPQAFADVPLAEALSRLAQPNGLILQFSNGSRPGEAPHLVAIRAIAPAAADGSSERRVTPVVSRRTPQGGLPAGFWDYEKSSTPLPPLDERLAKMSEIVQSRGPAATGALISVLMADPDPQARRSALGLLAGFSSDDARRAILGAAADQDASVRGDALRALSRTSGEKPVPLLTQMAKGDSDVDVRIEAIGLLSPKDGDLARVVLEGVMDDPDPRLREAAQKALRK